jgi:type II secretory pathway component PulJ
MSIFLLITTLFFALLSLSLFYFLCLLARRNERLEKRLNLANTQIDEIERTVGLKKSTGPVNVFVYPKRTDVLH